MELKLTKSRFKLAMECPSKLYYTGKPLYPNTKLDDPFLLALAEGGFQVGELAKLYYPGGYNIGPIDNDKALEQTNELLRQENVIIFEASVLYRDLFIKIDILEKQGNKIKLIEVKAKSIDTEKHDSFLTKDGGIKSVWSPYLHDAAFQKYVLSSAFPEYEVSAYLMLADKNSIASADGLNQRFFLHKDSRGRTSVQVTDFSDTGNKLLSLIKVDEEADIIYSTPQTLDGVDISFEEYVHNLSEAFVNGRKILHPIGAYCGKCEFHTSEDEETAGKISGFKECWKGQTTLTDEQFKKQFVFELWNYRKKQELIENHTYLLKDISESLFPEKDRKNPGLTDNERRLIQIQKVKNQDNTAYIDRSGIRNEIATWKFPLHFIDFETTMTAIPFNKGRRPYDGIAFQFSHHVVNEDGTIEHKGQYLNTEQGHFPNYDFVRALKRELEADNGSVFRYSPHENTYLAMIHRQLYENDIPDREELCVFIETITHSNESSLKKWRGSRDMNDLLEIVKRYYYHPSMKGSNSIKAVLPAVMQSEIIQQKYSNPVYGGKGNIKSLNFEDKIWIQRNDRGEIISPYKLLPSLFEDIDENQLDIFITDENLTDGGAAMTAYAKMQFTEMAQIEKERISKGLLRYCELDTLAMVMIYEYFRSEISH